MVKQYVPLEELILYREDDRILDFTVTQSSTIFDLTGYTPVFCAKESFNDTTPVFVSTCNVSSATGGYCTATIVNSQIPQEYPEGLIGELYVLSSPSNKRTLKQWELRILPSVKP